MKALITGASNGLGRDFAIKLSNMGYDVIIVARSKSKLESLKKEIKTNCDIEVMDLSIKENAYKLHDKYKNKIDLLINNAGFGDAGLFTKTDLDNELNMIDLNVVSYHILTKLFLIDFVKKDSGKILNVASSAAFEPGPLMATYYASKSYVYNLTMAIYEELRHMKSNVHVSVLCPGPVDTGFNDRAKVKFAIKGLSSDYVTGYALKCLNKNKLIIIPSFKMKMGIFANRLMSRKSIMKVIYNIQERKMNNEDS